ncbi:MAG TPA: PPE domain-containing protein [Mycobacterium sp.]|nr:PPE domain-containing protein [Mycobacterium sp.]
MNFAAVPPEVNSALMYSGPGSGSIVAAAAAWDAMAAELESAAGQYQTVIARLADESWRGPASVSMAAAAASYVQWMRTTAAQVRQAGTQAKAAAEAYENAFAMTVPPPVIAANRARLARLMATNIFGQNTPAIAATEALYSAMWAQDAAAMYGYAGSAAAATKLTSFTPPKQNTNPGGPGNQAASVMQTAATSAGSQAHTAASQLAAVPQALHGLAQPVAATATGAAPAYEGAGAPGLVLDLFGAGLEVGSFAPFEGGGMGLEFGGLAIEAASLGPFAGGFSGLGALGELGLMGQFGSAGGVSGAIPSGALASFGGAGGAGATWASVGKAASLGSLSVPQAWAAVAPSAMREVVREVVLIPAESSAAAASAVAAGGSGAPFAELALAGTAARAITGATGRGGREQARTTAPRRSVEPPPPEGTAMPDRVVAGIGIVGKLRALVQLRDSGILTQEKFEQQKQRLLER